MNRTREFALFETPLGRCGIAWGEDGIVALQLPEGTDARTRARLTRTTAFQGAQEALPPPAMRQAVAAIEALLNGQRDDLRWLRLDLFGIPPFHQRVYDAARAIPPGRTLTYGQVAEQLGEPGAARAVGQALGHNPFAIIVPCHRVLAAGARPGGFSANGGVATKLKLLEIEGARFGDTPGLFDT